MPRRRDSRVYRKGGRYYGDFRDYADVGGKLEALKPDGDTRATTDPDIAAKVASDRVEALERRRRGKHLLGVEEERFLAEFAEEHLIAKAKSGKFTETHLASMEGRLAVAVEFFGADRELGSITVRDMERFTAHLCTLPNRQGGTFSSGTVRHYLNALSNLYRRAQGQKAVPAGYNPVAAMEDKPGKSDEEAGWLEIHDGALLLGAARTYTPTRKDIGLTCVYPLIATFLLTGGRESEVLGLEVDDVSFDRRTITFRPNQWRRLKTKKSRRTVPLWPQLEVILREYVFGGQAPLGTLLFPSGRTAGESMITDIRKVLDALAERCGWTAGAIRTKALRHTYATARLQTLDRGAPVSVWTVSRELGHKSTDLIEDVYGHLGEIRHRSEVVEFRVENHMDVLAERVTAMRAWKPRRCPATTGKGEPCPFSPARDRVYCRLHDPERKRRRARERSKAQ